MSRVHGFLWSRGLACAVRIISDTLEYKRTNFPMTVEGVLSVSWVGLLMLGPHYIILVLENFRGMETGHIDRLGLGILLNFQSHGVFSFSTLFSS